MLEIKKKKDQKLTEGKILPKDDVTVYGTGASQFMKVGTEHVVHSHLAKQLVADGKAVMDIADIVAVDTEEIDTSNAKGEEFEEDFDPNAEGGAGKGGKKGGKSDEK